MPLWLSNLGDMLHTFISSHYQDRATMPDVASFVTFWYVYWRKPTFTTALNTKLPPKQHSCLTYIKEYQLLESPCTSPWWWKGSFLIFTQVNFQSLLICLISKTLYHRNKIFISKRRISFFQSVDRLRKLLNSFAKLANGTKLWLPKTG